MQKLFFRIAPRFEIPLVLPLMYFQQLLPLVYHLKNVVLLYTQNGRLFVFFWEFSTSSSAAQFQWNFRWILIEIIQSMISVRR